MTKSHRQRIRCVSLKFFISIEQHIDHMLNLRFVRSTGADNRLLYLLGTVLRHWNLPRYASANGGPPGLPQFECRISTTSHENIFNGHLFRAKFFDDRGNFAKDQA